jgi:hypothetical protein
LIRTGGTRKANDMVLAADRAAVVGLVLESALWGKHPFYRLPFDLMYDVLCCRSVCFDVLHHHIPALS